MQQTATQASADAVELPPWLSGRHAAWFVQEAVLLCIQRVPVSTISKDERSQCLVPVATV